MSVYCVGMPYADKWCLNDKSSPERNQEIMNLHVNGPIILESEMKGAAMSENVDYICDFEDLSCCSG